MKSGKIATLFVLVIALLSIGTGTGGAAQAKHTPSQRGGQAGTHMSSRGAAQGNHQWSADPERGWVRRDDAHEVNERRSAGKRQDQGRGQSNGKGKKF